MTFSAVLGQEPAVQTLQRALATGRLHHAYRFEGPAGTGKELTALALGQALACTEAPNVGCGHCTGCKRVVHWAKEPPLVPQHPDVLLIGKGIYGPPLISARETTGISVEQIRKLVLPRVAHGPHEARGLLVIIRDAEELTIAAANALLKTLEEPHANVHFVLLTTAPHRLLDTIRSRTQTVRFGPLPEECVRKLLVERGLDPSNAALAEGSAERALELANPEVLSQQNAAVEALARIVAAPTLEAGLEWSADLPKDRNEVALLLESYARSLTSEARATAATRPAQAGQAAARYFAVQRALSALDHNSGPQLVVEAMLLELRAVDA